MELIQYISIARRWLWFIVLLSFLGGSLGYIYRITQPLIYRAETKLVIGSYTTSPDPDSGEIRVAFDLTRTYAELSTTFTVLDTTVKALNLSISPNRLRETIRTSTIANTSILVISVEYGDPVIAADIANEVANQLILKSPTNLTPAQQAQIDLAQDQMNLLAGELENLRIRLRMIDSQLDTISSQDEINRLSLERTRLVDQINEATSNIAMFSSTITSVQQRTNSVSVVETAQIPTSPFGSGIMTNVLLSAMIGAALAFGIVLLFEYLNETFRNADEVVRVVNMPVVGIVAEIGKSKGGYKDKLISNNLFSQSLEEYRGLRFNLLFDQNPGEMRVVIVTSPSPAEGKTLTAANLAISIALSEKRVLLIDADLRRPKIHEVFNLSNLVGLSTLLNENIYNNTSHDDILYKLKTCVQDSGIPNLKVITSGFVPNNPTEILGSSIMHYWIDMLKKAGELDVIILDTPPCIAIADAVVLSKTVHADILLVVRANVTKQTSVLKAKERFDSVGARTAGIVLNGVSHGDEGYYGYYQ